MKKPYAIRRRAVQGLLGVGCLFFAFATQAFDINNIAPQAYHPGGINYWSAPYFANAIAIYQHNWLDKASGDEILQSSGQLNANGYPKYLDSGQTIKTLGIGMAGDWHQVAAWPDRDTFYEGQVVLTWKGDADIRISNYNATYVANDSIANATGTAVDGRRVYIIAQDSAPGIEIYSINTNNPITEVKCWLPDPADPQNSSLEDQIFHPFFLDLVDDRDWGWIRFMDFGFVNQNPQKDWIDRRPGGYAFQEGILNDRDPTEGAIFWIDNSTTPATTNYFTGDRETGASYETMVALCNETDRDMWINVPHLATDDFITKLAQLIRYGSDGFDPYTSDQASPIYPPLNTNLTVYVEFSNEIWSNGYSFPQGNWAQEQANALGITKPQFNAQQFSRAWSLFEAQLGTNRVNRVAAVWTANQIYTDDFINELYKPAWLDPEMMAVTTYFGNGIQNWAYDQNFVPTNSTPWTDPYWTSQDLEDDLTSMFTQWERYLLSGKGYGGATGFDAVDLPGGFGSYLRDIGLSNSLPIVAYEGGPSIYTDQLDRGNTEDDGITLLMNEANRRQELGHLYTIHINQGFERGLRANVGFTDVSQWGKYGQWGHVEYLGQPKEEAVKYQVMLNTFDTFSTLRSIDNPLGAQPQFDTAAELPRAETGTAYSQTIAVSGGDDALTVELIGLSLPAGLTYNTNTLTIAGTPSEPGSAYVYLRVVDADNDPAWRTFSIPVVSRSTDPAVTIDFEEQTLVSPIAVLPLVIGDYSLNCPLNTNNGLAVYDQNTQYHPGLTSTVLASRSWGNNISIGRDDGGAFDLFSAEIGSMDTDGCFIDIDQFGGGSSRLFVEFSKTNTYIMVPLELDLVSVTRVVFTFIDSTNTEYTDPRYGDFRVKNGVLDNIQLNQISAGMTYTSWGDSINWNGADSSKTGNGDGDGSINFLEYAMDTDPVTSNGPPSTITADFANAYLNYRRNTQATDLTWELMVTTNLLDPWSIWAVDNIRVFSEVVDPDVDGDGSAELMRYRVLMNSDQSLFFRMTVQ